MWRARIVRTVVALAALGSAVPIENRPVCGCSGDGETASQGGVDAPVEVRVFGSLRAIMHDGRTSTVASLEDWTPSDSLVAVGALSGLRGEITVLDGHVFLSRPVDDGSARTVEVDESDEKAALLVLAEVPDWIEIPIAEDLPFEGLDEGVRTLAAENGVGLKRPFPFVIEGTLHDLRWHTIDGSRLEEGGGHQAHERAGIRETLAETRGALIGFHSLSHRGIFTHGDTSTHFHVVTQPSVSSGHVDHVRVPAGAVLRVPAPVGGRATVG